MLIGIIPLVFMIYLSVQLYNERTQKIGLLKNYIERMHRSSDLSGLITNMQLERRYSFDYSLKKTMYGELKKQRPLTDSMLKKMTQEDETLAEFSSYTFFDQLNNVRNAIDSGLMEPGIVMDYYSSTIYRLNTLISIPTGSYIYMRPVYKDLVAQKLLSEMITFLGIMSANIYNALYSQKYMVEILVGTAGTYRVYKSYEKEFLLKASPETRNAYDSIKADPHVSETYNYIDTVFKIFSFDSSYTHAEWERISTDAIGKLSQFQQKLLAGVEQQTGIIYAKEIAARRRTLILIIFSVLFISAIVLYTIFTITQTLNELKRSAQKISLGESGQLPRIETNDVIGNLAHSIVAIDKNNEKLADAAQAIGQGQFDVSIEARSANDILGNAIVDMKTNLQKNTAELITSNKELERFAYIASHDLQEPLRMVSSFLSLLEEEHGKDLDASAKEYIRFAVDGAARMKILVNDLLQYSRVGTNKEEFTTIDLNDTMEYVIRVMDLEIKKNNAVVRVEHLPAIRGNKTLIGQIFINLIGNALKYHGEQPIRIGIGSVEEINRYIFYVRDNGVGIDPKYFDKIFIIFQRLHSKTEYSGTGIGLAICKKIAELHGGKIWVESEKGKGSTFYFSISKK